MKLHESSATDIETQLEELRALLTADHILEAVKIKVIREHSMRREYHRLADELELKRAPLPV